MKIIHQKRILYTGQKANLYLVERAHKGKQKVNLMNMLLNSQQNRKNMVDSKRILELSTLLKQNRMMNFQISMLEKNNYMTAQI